MRRLWLLNMGAGRLFFRAVCPRWLFLFLLFLSLSGCAAFQKPDGPFTLTLLHTNDVHGEYSGLDADGRTCETAVCNGGSGGIIRLRRAVSALRKTVPEALFLDAGDQFQGSLLFTLYREDIVADLVQTAGYDAMVPGNHEFDEGCDPFLNLLQFLELPVVAANLSFSDDMVTEADFYPWVVVTHQKRRIGIIGLTNPNTPWTASPCAEAAFSDPAFVLGQVVAELTRQGVNIIIALTHLGLEADLDLARQVSGVDVIVGGHTHSLLSNTDPDAAGPYPLVAWSPKKEPVLVVTAGSRLTRLGNLEVTFDAGGRAIWWQGESVPLNDAALKHMKAPPPDPVLVKKMTAYTAPVPSLRKTVIGRIVRESPDKTPSGTSDFRHCRREECLTGNIVTDALRDAVKPDTRAFLINGGSVRAAFPDGSVTELDLLSALPFDNRVMTADVPGHVLLAMLEHSVAGRQKAKGRFLLPAGLKYTFDPRRPSGKRLISVLIQDEIGQWRPVDPDTAYPIGTLSYLAEGGDGYTLLTHLEWTDTGILVRDAVKSYFLKTPSLYPRIEGRVMIHPIWKSD